MIRLRHCLRIGPSKREVALDPNALVTFAPMEMIAEGKGGLDTSLTRSCEELASGSYNYFAEGDVLLAKVTPCFENGKKAVATRLIGGIGFATSEVHVLRPDPHRLDTRFLMHLLGSRPLVSAGIASMTGAGGLRRVSEQAILDFPLPISSVAEQRRIADELDRQTHRLDALIDAKRRQAEVLLEREEGTFADIVTGRDRQDEKTASGVDWIGDMPTHWTAPKMVHVARQETGHTPSRKIDEYWLPEDCMIPWFSLADVWQIRQAGLVEVAETAERISQLGMDNSAARLLPVDTVILSRTASVGFPAILGVPMAVTQDFVGWICGPRVLPRYLYYVLRSMKPVFRSLMIGSTHQTIYMPDIRSFRMPLPPLDEQVEIVSRLDRTTGAFRRAAAEIQRSIKLLEERREAMITAAVASPAASIGAGTPARREPEAAAPPRSSAIPLRTAIAAEIIHRHRNVLRFGRVKLQKLMYLAETHVGLDEISGSYLREAAGPFDSAMIERVEGGLRGSRLYETAGGDGTVVSYRPLASAGAHAADLEAMGSERLTGLRAVIDLVRDLDTRAAEMVATLYAVWNDDLIDGRQISDDAIVEGVLDEWHPKKRTKFSTADLHHWLAWMKRVGLTPRGRGPRTIPTMQTDLFAERRS